jgi:hypothetical protein
MKKLILLIATVCVIGCANPEFERYARTRQAEIAYMPNGKAKQQAQGELDADRKVDQQRRKDQGADSAAIIGSTLLFGIPGLLISDVVVAANHAGAGDFKRDRALNEKAKQYNAAHSSVARPAKAEQRDGRTVTGAPVNPPGSVTVGYNETTWTQTAKP